MIHYRYIQRDGVFGIEHRFTLATDSTPWHQHLSGWGHSVQLVTGRARLEFKDGTSVNINKDEFEFNVTALHRITATRSNTIVFNRIHPTLADMRRRLEHEGDWQCL